MANFLPQFEIVEQSESKLVCQKKPGILSNLVLILWMIFFAGVPLGLLIAISSEYGIATLSCQRVEPKLVDCIWSKSQYLGFVQTIQDRPIENVTDAQFKSAQWFNETGGGSRKVWVSLITYSGSERLFETQYAIESGFNPQFQSEAASQIKTFINSQEASFNLKRDTRLSEGFWGGVPLFGVYPLVAILAIYVSLRSQTIILDKANDRYIRHIHTILGTRTKKYKISDIQSIQTTEVRHIRRGMRYQLTIVLQSGKQYKLPGIRNEGRVRDIATRFQEFLGLR